MSSAFVARHRGKLIVLVVLGVLALAGLFYLYQQGVTLDSAFVKLKTLASMAAEKSPAYYVAALALLPYVGVPSSLLYLAAGTVYGPTMGIIWSALGLALNLPLGYFAGKHWLREPIARMLEKRGHKLAVVPASEFTRIVVLMRIIPGPPLVIQNFLIAMMGVPFGLYYLLSLPLTLLFAAGILLTSGAMVAGNTKLIIAGVCTVIALTLMAHVVKAINQANKKK